MGSSESRDGWLDGGREGQCVVGQKGVERSSAPAQREQGSEATLTHASPPRRKSLQPRFGGHRKGGRGGGRCAVPSSEAGKGHSVAATHNPPPLGRPRLPALHPLLVTLDTPLPAASALMRTSRAARQDERDGGGGSGDRQEEAAEVEGRAAVEGSLSGPTASLCPRACLRSMTPPAPTARSAAHPSPAPLFQLRPHCDGARGGGSGRTGGWGTGGKRG